jgi:hypothetical protein
MNVDFWTDHSFLFILGLIFIPRMMLIYFGLITPFSVSAILGATFVPRIMLMTLFSAVYCGSNPTTMIIFWIIAIIVDIVDTILIKGRMSWNMQKQYMKAYPPPWQHRY